MDMQQSDNQLLCDAQVTAECWAGETGGPHHPGGLPGAGSGSSCSSGG